MLAVSVQPIVRQYFVFCQLQSNNHTNPVPCFSENFGHTFVVHYLKLLCENNYIGFFLNRSTNDKNVARKNKIDIIKKMLQKFQKKIFSVEVSEKIFSVQYFTVMILILSLYQTSSFHCCKNNVLRIILYLSK